MTEKIIMNGMVLYLEDGVLKIEGTSTPVEVNNVEVYSVKSKNMKESISEFIQKNLVKTEDFFTDFTRTNFIEGYFSYKNHAFQILIPRNAEVETVKIIVEDVVNPKAIYDFLDSKDSLTDNHEAILKEIEKIENLFAPLSNHKVSEIGVGDLRFRRGSFKNEPIEMTKEDLVLTFFCSQNSKIEVEHITDFLEQIIFYKESSHKALVKY